MLHGHNQAVALGQAAPLWQGQVCFGGHRDNEVFGHIWVVEAKVARAMDAFKFPML